METESVAGIILVGATAITYAGFGVFPSRIYVTSDADVRIKLVEQYPRRWTLSQTLVMAGGALSVVGLVLVARLFHEPGAILLAWVGAVCFAAGFLFWARHLAARISSPRRFARGELPRLPFQAYSVLTAIGLVAFGLAFWLEGFDQLLGLGLAAGGMIALVVFYIVKDMPPFVYYAMTLVVGLVMLA